MISVRLDESNVARAEKMAQEVCKTARLKRASYTGLSGTLHTYTTCYLGELALKSVLEARGRAAVYRYGTDGKSKPDEFVVYINGVAYPTDVKTAGNAWAKNMLMPKAQFDRNDSTLFYIGARKITDDEIQLWGAIGRSSMRLVEVVDGVNDVPTKSVALDALVPIENWIDMLDAGQVTERKI